MHFDCPSHIAQFIRKGISFDQEYVGCLVFDSQLDCLGQRILFQGTADSCQFHPRDLFRFIYQTNGTRFILYHNHTSLNALPSYHDLLITRQVHLLASLFEVEFLDHIIVTRTDYSSLKDLGYLKDFRCIDDFKRRYGLLSRSRARARRT